MNYKLKTELKVWKKDTNSLFDYECNEYHISEQLVTNTCSLFRNLRNYLIINNNDWKTKSSYLTHVKQTKDNYFISFNNDHSTNNQNENQAFIVLRHTEFKEKLGRRLKEGDIIRFGKIVFKVNELYFKEEFKLNYNDKGKISQKHTRYENKDIDILENKNDKDILVLNKSTKIKDSSKEIDMTKKKAFINCKVCLFDDNDLTNPLINPCKCAGSMKYIHLNCLKQWLKSKINTKTLNYLIIHSFYTFECEICKYPLPEKILIRNEIHNLIEISKPSEESTPNYISLESVNTDKKEIRYLYIIQLKDKKTFTIGRSNDSDLRMTDISVSRYHAKINIINKNFYLCDNYSKFGTLIQLQKEIMLVPYKPLSLQIGKSFIFFEVCKTIFGMFNCCYRYPQKNLKDYNDIIDETLEQSEEKIFNCDYASVDNKTDNFCFETKNVEKVIEIKGNTHTDFGEVKKENESCDISVKNDDISVCSRNSLTPFKGEVLEIRSLVSNNKLIDLSKKDRSNEKNVLNLKDSNNSGNFLLNQLKELQSINNMLNHSESHNDTNNLNSKKRSLILLNEENKLIFNELNAFNRFKNKQTSIAQNKINKDDSKSVGDRSHE